MTNLRNIRFLITAIIISAILMLTACPLRQQSPLSIKYPASAQEFRESIDWYDTALSNTASNDKVKSRAHIRLSLLHSHYRNPDRNIKKALEHINAYIDMAHDKKPADAIMNHRNMLQTILEAGSDKYDNSEGNDPLETSVIRMLKKENKTLTQENEELKKTIEKLNALDVELEKKRKSMR